MQHLQTDSIEKITRIAKQKENENYRFRSFLKGQDSENMDRIVHRLNKEIVELIDCTACGNCCNNLRPCVTNKEIIRLAQIDNMSHEEFVQNFTAKDKFDPVFYLKDTPCKYLKDKKCMIHTDRPEDCKSYPHTHKKSFTSRTLVMINNYGICPIVFNLFERLKKELGFT